MICGNVVPSPSANPWKNMEHKLDEFIRHAIEAQPISGTSLIISLYGDALSHRGGEVWLGSPERAAGGPGFW
jgi:phenylacetic acid degradation operon negative regulatory protein